MTRFALLLLALLASPAPNASARVAVGSKAFPESWILGETLARLLRAERIPEVTHRADLGGTEIVFQALRAGDLDVYPEYTGTISQVLLHRARPEPLAAMRIELARLGLGASEPLGFEDGYAIAVRAEVARRLGLRTLSDLARHPELRLGLTHEFLGRPDGWPGLARRYGLHPRTLRGIEHEVAYGALAAGRIDGTDVYTTDAQIERLRLTVLADDLGYFPRYDAVWLYRLDLPRREPGALAAMRRLAGRIDAGRMIRANARVVIGGEPYARAADELLADLGLGGRAPPETGLWGAMLRNTLRHLELVALSLLAAILAGIPLGILAARSARLAGAILAFAGALQTVPSLALLAILVPLLGIGVAPALAALFLYSLLPIVSNTCVGLTTIPPPLLESAEAIGLSPRARLLRVRLPLASPAIMAGIKTSAVIDVGTATLAALIGAGGLGEPILSGIQLRSDALILQGAIPAALLALAVQRLLGLADRIVIPRGLRLPSGR